MKKSIVFCLMLMGLMFSSTVDAADNIGIIDMQRILKFYKGAAELQTKMLERRESFQKVVEEKQAQLEEARARDEKEEKMKELVQKIDEELAPQREQILRAEAEAQRSLLSKVVQVSQVVSKEYGIDVVVDKNAVYVGGFDLTEFVIDRLNR